MNMNTRELRTALENGALRKYAGLYRDVDGESARYIAAIDAFTALYGEKDELFLFSVPGRTEVSGNHTDHNRGRVLAAAIDRDIIAVAARNADGVCRVKSEGYDEDRVEIAACKDPSAFADFSSASLIAGTVGGCLEIFSDLDSGRIARAATTRSSRMMTAPS